MKFSSALQFNSVPEWAEYYIAYSYLKKVLYNIEKDLVSGVYDSAAQDYEPLSPTEEGLENNFSLILSELPDVSPAQRIAVRKFVIELNKEMLKIEDFYRKKEGELSVKTHKLNVDYENFLQKYEDILDKLKGRVETDAASFARRNSVAGLWIDEQNVARPSQSARTDADLLDEDSDSDSEAESTRKSFSKMMRKSSFFSRRSDAHMLGSFSGGERTQDELSDLKTKEDIREAQSTKRSLTTKAREMYISISDLQMYIQLNFTGFKKILKKFDKVIGCKLKLVYEELVLQKSYMFSNEAKTKTNDLRDDVVLIYSDIVGHKTLKDAITDLKTFVRDQVVWDRNTIWRDMIQMERKVGAVEMVAASSTLEKMKKEEWSKNTVRLFTIALCVAVFIFFMIFSPFTDNPTRRCWALLVFVSLMWATEAIPLHVTALTVPLLVVALQVLLNPDTQEPYGTVEAAKMIFSSMFSSVIMLLLGGFTIAAALSKHNLAKMAASWVLSKVDNNPASVLLANMFVSTFLSMWISNVASPVLCFSLIQPILRTLPPGHPLAPCLIIGIALASNVGGMASPIASPQNIIAIGIMDPAPSWLQWFIVSIPVCIISNLGVWLLLLLVYKPSTVPYKLNKTRFVPEKLNNTQIYVIVVSVATITLWCLSSQISWLFGDMGVLAILPIIFLFGSPSVLSKEDFNNFLWTVVVLAMGGSALGKAVMSSGLLHKISTGIASSVNGLSTYMVMFYFCLMVLVSCTFISHTVGALIILPIFHEIGLTLPGNQSRMLVMSSALMCSGAMGLPVSGFPNMNAIMIEDQTGTPYLTVKDFFKAGIPASVVAFFVIVTVGYATILFAGF